MKKNVEAVVSAMGALLSIIVELVRLIKEYGGEIGADIYRLAQAEGQGTLKDIARLIVECGQRVRNTFRLVVDYGLSLAQMIAAGKYDWVNSDITAEHFPVSGQGKQAVEVELWRLNKYFKNGDEVIAELERVKPDYRPATLPELLALGAAQPELQKQFPIVALGSIWPRAVSDRRFVCLFQDDALRGLGLGWLGGIFYDPWRFAVVRK